MFGLDWSELALIGAVALIVIGPKDLPRVLRTAGQWAGRARAMAREFQRNLEDIAKEADLDDIRQQAEKAAKFNFADEVTRQIDPDGSVRKSLEPPPELSGPLGSSAAPQLDAAAMPSADLPTAAEGDTTPAAPTDRGEPQGATALPPAEEAAPALAPAPENPTAPEASPPDAAPPDAAPPDATPPVRETADAAAPTPGSRAAGA